MCGLNVAKVGISTVDISWDTPFHFSQISPVSNMSLSRKGEEFPWNQMGVRGTMEAINYQEWN